MSRHLNQFQITEYEGLRVVFLPHLDGGGRSFGQAFVPAVRQLFGPVDRVFEFCAGPGFIGFSLLALGLCRSLVLADINPEAVTCIRKTIALNKLADRVDAYESDGLRAIPASEKWDLVVGNPPHFAEPRQAETDIIRCDPGWQLHSEFYADVASFLKPHGSVLLMANSCGSRWTTFQPAIERGGLRLVDAFAFSCPDTSPPIDSLYFAWSRVAHPSVVSCLRTPRVVEIEIDRNSSRSTTPLPIDQRVVVRIINKLPTMVVAELQSGSRQQRPLRIVAQPSGITESPAFVALSGVLHVITSTECEIRASCANG